MNKALKLMTSGPKLVLVLFALFTVAIGWQVRNFEIDASAETLLTKNNEHYIRTRIVSERFSPQEFLFVAYRPLNGELFSEATYADLRELKQSLSALERVESVRSLLDVPLLSLMEGNLATASPAEWTLEQKNFSAAQMREALSGNPIYENLLVNEEQSATALQVLFRADPELEALQSQITEIQQAALERELSEEEEQRIDELREQAEPLENTLNEQRYREIERIRALTTEYGERAEILLGGTHVLGFQLISIIQNDLYLFGAVIAGMIVLVLYLFFGSLRWVLLPLTACGVSVLVTMGLFGLLGLKTTVISSNFIALQLILTLAIVIHLIVQYREYCDTHGDWNQRQLVEHTVMTKAAPCFYAGLTTSIGFASLLFTGLQPVIAFGWMMIIAMAVSISVSLLLFPTLMVLLPREHKSHRHFLAKSVLQGFHGFTSRLPGLTLLLCLLALGFGIAGLPRLSVENSFINYFSEDTQVYNELSFIDRELGGSTPLDLVLNIPETELPDPDLVVSAEQVQEMQRVQALLRQQEGMGKVLSIVNFTELARKINGDQPLTEYELSALYHTIDDNLREGLIGSYFSDQARQVRLSARVMDSTEDLNRQQLIDNIRGGMQQLGYDEDDYILTNLFVLYQDILQRLYHSQVLSLGIVYALLGLCFLVIFRSLKISLIALAPNLLSTAGILGFMGWLGIPLDLMTITIASIAMGIAVDDTIHYIHRYREEQRQTDDEGTPVSRSTFSVGYAMLYTSLIIMLGFSQLVFSDFIPSVQFGLLAGLAMLMALVWNLLLLPVLLKRFVSK